MPYYRRKIRDWLRTLEIKANNVLDIGGERWSVRSHPKVWKVKNYQTINEDDVDLNIDQNYSPKYDVIFCTEVLQFVYRPFIVLKNLHDLLEEGGMLYISFLFVHSPQKSHDCLRYTRIGTETLLEKTGFKIIEITPIRANSPEKLRDFYSDYILRPKEMDYIGFLVKAKK